MLSNKEVSQKLVVTQAVNRAKKERDELKFNLQEAELKQELSEKSLTEKYETQINHIVR